MFSWQGRPVTTYIYLRGNLRTLRNRREKRRQDEVPTHDRKDNERGRKRKDDANIVWQQWMWKRLMKEVIHAIFCFFCRSKWGGYSRVYLLKERDAPSEVQIKQVMVSVGEKLDVDLSEVKRWGHSDRQLKCQIKYHQGKVAQGWTRWCRSDNHCPVVSVLSVIRASISHYRSTTEVQKLIRKLLRSVWSCNKQMALQRRWTK